MSDYVTIGGVSTLDYNALLLDDYIEGAVRDYDVIKVPGRNGDLHIDNGRFLNRKRTITLYFPNGKEDIEAFEEELQAVGGYVRIESTLNPDIYMMGRYTGGLRPKKTARYEAARADFVFDCSPQKFLTSGDEPIELTATQRVVNPTLHESKPLLTVVGSGTVTIGSATITIDTEQESITIDCETGDCYNGSTNCNSDVSFSGSELPTLPQISSNVILDGVTSVTIVPRWYTI